jgi:hypothetical protein
VNKRFYRGLTLIVLILANSGLLHAQPTILQQPLSLLNQLLGDTVSLCVGAQSPSSTNLEYQWLRNGVIIPGATNSCLSISGIQAVDCGAFSVLVSDGVGVAVSEPADVTVDLNIFQLLDGLIDSLDLLQTSGTIRSYNTGAVKQPGTPDIIPGDPGGSEVWFQWRVPLLQSSGIVTFSTLGSDFDTTMAAYTGSEPNNLTPVPTAINDDDAGGYLNSQVTFYAVAGTTYTIAVDGFYGAQGNVVLGWNLYPNSPKLPNSTNAPQFITASNGANVSLNSPWPGYKCDWLLNGTQVGTNLSAMTVSNLGPTNVGAYVARYTVSDGVAVSAEPIELQINTLQDGSTSTNSSAWIKYLNSANSAFAQPAPMKTGVIKLGGGGDSGGYSCSQTFSTAGNSDEPGEPVVCNQSAGHPGWYTYVTPASGSMVISTAGSTFNTVLGVFVGPGNSFSTLTNVGCGYTTNYKTYGQPSVILSSVPAGQTNYIVVEGANGASGTARLNIALGNPVAVSAPPQSQTVGPGSNVTLALSATGSSPISYTWQFNGNNIPGATNGTLTISGMQSSTAGTYTVVVSNAFSVESPQAVVSLGSPVAITTPPQNQSAGPGTNVTLSVAATGSTPMSFNWQFDGTNILGATEATLNITNMQASYAGTYTVILSNAFSVVSTQAVVSYVVPPTIITQPKSHSISSSSTATVSVAATGSPGLSYEWFFNGASTGVTNSTFSISGFQQANEGQYTVTISNSAGVVTSEPAVLLLDGPLRVNACAMNNGSFSLQMVGPAGTDYIIEASSDLINWVPMATNNSPDGILNFTDTNAGSQTCQFYRAVNNAASAIARAHPGVRQKIQ